MIKTEKNMRIYQDLKSLALYIHWPWCKKKCPYCDFNSHVNETADTDIYVDALITDLKTQACMVGPRKLTSIFFGGGTPSLMRPDQINRILRETENCFTWDDAIEITLEANPTSSSREQFQKFASVGINRISIGVQSLQPKILSFLGREHSKEEAISTIEAALSIVQNVNIDFIYGVKNHNLNHWKSDIKEICDIGTHHVSAYQLTIEPQTRFYSDVKKGKWSPISDDDQAAFYEESVSLFSTHGFEIYEISNFSRPNMQCKHNLHVWRYGDYLGIGAGAHGRLKTLENQHISTYNYKMPHKYISHVKSVKHGMFQKNILSAENRAIEKVLMGLRLKEGVQLNEHLYKYVDISSLTALKEGLFLELNQDRLRLTPKGFLQLDAILPRLVTL